MRPGRGNEASRACAATAVLQPPTSLARMLCFDRCPRASGCFSDCKGRKRPWYTHVCHLRPPGEVVEEATLAAREEPRRAGRAIHECCGSCTG